MAEAAPAGLHRQESKVEIMHAAEALFRAAGAEWRPGRMAKHIRRHLDRGDRIAACRFVVDELADANVNVHSRLRNWVGIADPTGQQAAALADLTRAARHLTSGDLEKANAALDANPYKKNAPAGQGEGADNN